MSKTKWFGKAVLAVAVTLAAPSASWAAQYVRGYYRSDGTYVQPYWRSDRDGNPLNNYGYPGNLNPYTGEVAPGNPDTYLRNYYERDRGFAGYGSHESRGSDGGFGDN
jgi:hypothetical protein